jgi:hypothetical protein
MMDQHGGRGGLARQGIHQSSVGGGNQQSGFGGGQQAGKFAGSPLFGFAGGQQAGNSAGDPSVVRQSPQLDQNAMQSQQNAQHAMMQRLYSESNIDQQTQQQPTRSVRGGLIPSFTSQAVSQLAKSPHSPFSGTGTGPLDHQGLGLAVQYIRDALECRKVQLRALTDSQRTAEKFMSNGCGIRLSY